MRTTLLALSIFLAASQALAQDDSWKQALGDARERVAELREEVVQIPLRGATREEQAFPLTGTLYQPPGPGPFPVVVLNHGSPARSRDRDVMGRWRLLPQVREIVGWGVAVLVPMRRGYGASPGDYVESHGACGQDADFARSARESARDVLSALDFVRTRPSLDAGKVVLMGQSAGGFASLATAAQAPAGVLGVVNLAGGRGGNGRDGQPCAPAKMAQLLATFGAATRVPSLWVYAENDLYFGPEAVRSWFAAYQGAGAQSKLVMQPPHGRDGHLQFYAPEAIPRWSPPVREFLRSVGLP